MGESVTGSGKITATRGSNTPTKIDIEISNKTSDPQHPTLQEIQDLLSDFRTAADAINLKVQIKPGT